MILSLCFAAAAVSLASTAVIPLPVSSGSVVSSASQSRVPEHIERNWKLFSSKRYGNRGKLDSTCADRLAATGAANGLAATVLAYVPTLVLVWSFERVHPANRGP